MDLDEKLDWEAKRQEVNAKREQYDASVRDLAAYDSADCDIKCKTVFNTELLKWKQKTFEACVENSRSIECREAESLKTSEEE